MNNAFETIVGEQTTIRGNLQGDEDLTVRGRVEGTITLSKTLMVETGGIVLADMDVRNAIVSGVVVGNIRASEVVQINEDGRMVGDITAPRVIIVAGASFKGNVDMGDIDRARPETPRAQPPERSRPTVAARPTTRPAARPTRPIRSQERAIRATQEPESPPRSSKTSTPAAKPVVKSAPKPPPKPTPKRKRAAPKPPSVAKGKKKIRRKK